MRYWGWAFQAHAVEPPFVKLRTGHWRRPFEGEAAKPPISLHPAFPAIVALWFAALLGIGTNKDLCTVLETRAGFVEPEPAKKK